MDTDTIKKRIEMIEKLQGEIKTAKQMLEDALESDSLYQETAEEAKVSASKKKQLQNEVYNQSENAKLVMEIKENREEIATLKEMLSEELIEYRTQHKTETIEVDGAERVFKFSVKLSPKK